VYEQFMHHNGISTRETPLGTIVLCEFQRLPRLICGKFCWRLVPHQRKRSLPPPPQKKKKPQESKTDQLCTLRHLQPNSRYIL